MSCIFLAAIYALPRFQNRSATRAFYAEVRRADRVRERGVNWQGVVIYVAQQTCAYEQMSQC